MKQSRFAMVKNLGQGLTPPLREVVFIFSRAVSFYELSIWKVASFQSRRGICRLDFARGVMVTTQQLAILAVFATLLFALKGAFGKKKAGKLPPGPKGKPIIGNLLDLPPPGQQECTHWFKHKEEYGESSHLGIDCVIVLVSQTLY